MSLIAQLAVATAMTMFTMLVHLAGLAALLMLIRYRAGDTQPRALPREIAGIIGAALGLFALHGLEIWIYAALYTWAGALPDFATALYFSTSTYTTVGYGDVVLTPPWRVIGAIEGANGIILLGWSTAFFVAMVSRITLVETVLKTRS